MIAPSAARFLWDLFRKFSAEKSDSLRISVQRFSLANEDQPSEVLS
jgi:hypothetical protein